MTRGLDGAPPGLVAEIWERDEYRAGPYLSPGSAVLDIGAHVGVFTIWAARQGALVTAVEPLQRNTDQLLQNVAAWGLSSQVTVHRAAAGNTDGVCHMIERGLGVQTQALNQPGVPVPMLSLATLIDGREIDVCKIDAEGAEYPTLLDADLSPIRYLTLELHRWATPDDPVPGLGLRDYPMPYTPQELVDWISRTHDVELNGSLTAGGYLYAKRRRF